MADEYTGTADIRGLDNNNDDDDNDFSLQPMLTIRQVNGGFIIADQDGVETPFEEKEFHPTDNDAEMTQRMLYFIINFFGLGGSKHDAERIVVDIEKKGEE